MTRQQTLYGKIPKKRVEYTVDVSSPNQIRVPPKICPNRGDMAEIFRVIIAISKKRKISAKILNMGQTKFDNIIQTIRIMGLINTSREPLPPLFAFEELTKLEQLARVALAFEKSDVGQAWIKWSGVKSIKEIDANSSKRFIKAVVPGIKKSTAEHKSNYLRRICKHLKKYYPVEKSLPSKSKKENVKSDVVLDKSSSSECITVVLKDSSIARVGTGFWNIWGHEEIARNLKGTHMRLLIGKSDSFGWGADTIKLLENPLHDFEKSVNKGSPSPWKRKALLRLERELLDGTARIKQLVAKSYEKFHAKIYIGDNVAAYVSSANLTRGGLRTNVESGSIVTKQAEVDKLVKLFDEWFEEGDEHELLQGVIEIIENSWALSPPTRPALIFLRTLLELYQASDYLDLEDAPELADYQKLIVGYVIRKLLDENGALLISPTGSGKTVMGTYVAAALRNSGVRRIIVSAPNDIIRHSWKKEFSKFAINVNVYNHSFFQDKIRKKTKLEELKILKESIRETDLIIIDEVHAFYNPKTKGYEGLFDLLGKDYGRGKPKRLLMSATPMSTGHAQLKTLLSLSDDTFSGMQPEKYSDYGKLINVTLPLIMKEFGVLQEETKVKALKFPKEWRYFATKITDNITYEDPYPEIYGLIEKLDLRSAEKKVFPSGQEFFDDDEEPDFFRPGRPGTLSKFTMAKCTESSIASCAKSMENLFLKVKKNPDKYFNSDDLIEGLQHILEVCDEKIDKKYFSLRKLIESQKNPKSMIIFTTYVSTVDYLHTQLNKDFPKFEIFRMIGKDGSQRRQRIIDDFAPMAQGLKKRGKSKWKILICTDCISEGHNLQDANMIVNYDLHWTPLKLIQRIGRLDRPTLNARKFEVWNMYPGHNAFEKLVGMQTRLLSRDAMLEQFSGEKITEKKERKFGEKELDELGYVRQIYTALRSDEDYNKMVDELTPTTEHLAFLAQSTSEQRKEAMRLKSYAKSALLSRKNPSGYFLLIETEDGVKRCIWANNSKEIVSVSPEALIHETQLAKIKCSWKSKQGDLHTSFDSDIERILNQFYAKYNLNEENIKVICAEKIN